VTLAALAAVESTSLTALATILVAFLSLIGTVAVGVLTTRSSRRASDQATRLELDKLEAQRVNDLRGDLAAVREGREVDRKGFIEEMARQREQHALEVAQWRARVLQLDERQQDYAKRLSEPEVSAVLIEQNYAIPPTPRGFGLMDTDPGWRLPPPREP
jgi:hypothetical protein